MCAQVKRGLAYEDAKFGGAVTSYQEKQKNKQRDDSVVPSLSCMLSGFYAVFLLLQALTSKPKL